MQNFYLPEIQHGIFSCFHFYCQIFQLSKIFISTLILITIAGHFGNPLTFAHTSCDILKNSSFDSTKIYNLQNKLILFLNYLKQNSKSE